MNAQTGRADYDATLTIAGLDAGEPIFVLRARDALAIETIQAWATLAHNAGVDTATIEQALAQADKLAAWPGKKLPDAPRVADDVAKQLRYKFKRRAWRHGLPDYDGMMAKTREAAA